MNPDTTSFIAAHSFTVVSGGGAKLWASLVGRSLIGVGTPSIFNLAYGNTRLNDAYFARLWLTFPTANLSYQIDTTLTQPQITGNPIDLLAVPPDVKVGSQTVVPLIVPVVPAGGSGSIPIIFTAPSLASDIPLKTWINPAGSASIAPVLSASPEPPNGSPTIGTYTTPQCYTDMTQYAFEAFAFSSPPVCWSVFPPNSQNAAANAVTAALNGNFSLNNFLMSLTQYLDQQGLAVNQRLTNNGVGQADWSPILDSTIQNIVDLVEDTITKNDCKVEVEIDEDADDSEADDDSGSDTTGRRFG